MATPHRNTRMLRLVWSRVEIENAFSWLSTLGGAYSALGDYFEHCAEEAGRISMRQYRLSRMLGDDSLAARSRLYSALAFAQKGNLKVARHIVRNIAAFARETHDKRLNRMCQGVWAKLKYLRAVKNTPAKLEAGSFNGNINSGFC
ncbi:jg20840 [Pararge aegeria aegeria]|uniref:Jg20840 protein n=1 Tax=Pararge aegeria aegeria TaxID=348720 RepID=A0A8S4R3P4_9NEOP|nr:jg20840 [Pararge aegeria aegeria]